MKNVVIAAGYATRLGELTKNFPKPLLKVGNNTILDRLLDDIDQIEDIDEHVVVTNHKFAPIFEKWACERMALQDKNKKPIRIIDDGTSTNETRLGAVRDLLLAISGNPDGCASDSVNKQTAIKLQRTGVIAVDKDMKVLEMQEKPEKPVSNWAVPPFYIYNKKDIPLILDCMNHGCGFDAPGNLAHYLVGQTTIYAWPMPGTRFDIGSLDSYKEAQRVYGGE